MPAELTFTDETEIEVAADSESPSFEKVHLQALSSVLTVDHEDGEIDACTIDLNELVKVMTLYSSMEVQRYDWR